jgi:hypothetical protein
MNLQKLRNTHKAYKSHVIKLNHLTQYINTLYQIHYVQVSVLYNILIHQTCHIAFLNYGSFYAYIRIQAVDQEQER